MIDALTTLPNERMALLLEPLGFAWDIRWSRTTKRFYVESNVSIVLAPGMYQGISEHRFTPDHALAAFFDRLTHVPKHQTIGAGGRHWRWNGACFTEVEAPT